MKRKTTVYKGLEFVNVYYTDLSLTSPDYFQITEFPNRLTSGKNLFKLKGHPTNLKVGGYLNLEILDYNGDPIYHEIVDYIDEDKSRVIAIYIYEDSSPGECVITILAEAVTVNNQPVPADWRGRSNVKWQRTIAVNPTVSNESEIIFETLPTVSLREQVAPHLDRTYALGQFPTYSTGNIKYTSLNGQPVIELIDGAFTPDMKTGTVTVNTPNNAFPQPAYTPISTTYTSTIKKILTPTLAVLDSEYTVYSNQSISSHTFNSFDASSYTLSYESTPTYTQTQNSESYALVEIKDLEPATGDVSRIKMYMNNNGTIGIWEPIIDIELDETEIFVTDTGSLFPDKSIGTIESQTTIDTYWQSVTYIGKTEMEVDPTLTYSNVDLTNAINVTSTTNIAANNAVHILKINPTYNGVFLGASSYKVTFDAIGTRDSYSNNMNPVLSVYMSGSAFNYDVTDILNQELPTTLGKRIGRIEIDSTSKRFDDYVLSFEADATGEGTLLFVIESGQWQIADIRTTTDNDAGYTPNYTRLKALVPTAHKINNQLTFKIEYYNVAGVKSKQINYISNLDWEGGNRYVDGNYSMLTGSLYVADSLNSGVAISGYPNSGFIRSLGYEGFNAGFPGFLLWSGSAMPTSTTTYQGVGLELYANTDNYFRFRTDPSELIVKTQTFFLGSTSPANFISGSNGNLEISSSNFHLLPNGDLSASNGDYSGVSSAQFFRNKSITINQENSSSYLRFTEQINTPNSNPLTNPWTPAYYTLVVDGTLGGEIAQHVIISCSLKYRSGTGYSYPICIAGIDVPGIFDNQAATVTVEIGSVGVFFRDDVGAFGAALAEIELNWDTGSFG
jgi:hypothetical protein